jgi:integrase
MGHLSPFFVKPIILQCDENAGERLPMLMHRATHLPVTRVLEWALLSRRTLVASNTLGREIREVGHFEHWMLTVDLNLDDPFAFADAFTPIRIQASLRPWFGRDFSDRKVKKLAVSPEHVRSRFETTLGYVDWHLRKAQSSLSVRTQANEIVAFEIVRQNIEKALREVMPTQSSEPDIEGLDDATVARVFQRIAVEDRSSAWGYGNSERTLVLRKRNQLIVTLMLCFGIRRGDLLKLVTGDVLTHGPDPVLAVRRRPDDPRDSRLIEPNSKTQPRDLPLDPVVTRQLNDFVANYRKLMAPCRFVWNATSHLWAAAAAANG